MTKNVTNQWLQVTEKKNGTTDKNYYTKITRKKSIKKIKFANRGESLEVKVTVYKNDK